MLKEAICKQESPFPGKRLLWTWAGCRSTQAPHSECPSGEDHVPKAKSFTSYFIPRPSQRGQCWGGEALRTQVLTVGRQLAPSPSIANRDRLCTSKGTALVRRVPSAPPSIGQPGSPAVQGAARRACRCSAAPGAIAHRHKPRSTASLCLPPSTRAVQSQTISCTREAPQSSSKSHCSPQENLSPLSR